MRLSLLHHRDGQFAPGDVTTEKLFLELGIAHLVPNRQFMDAIGHDRNPHLTYYSKKQFTPVEQALENAGPIRHANHEESLSRNFMVVTDVHGAPVNPPAVAVVMRDYKGSIARLKSQIEQSEIEAAKPDRLSTLWAIQTLYEHGRRIPELDRAAQANLTPAVQARIRELERQPTHTREEMAELFSLHRKTDPKLAVASEILERMSAADFANSPRYHQAQAQAMRGILEKNYWPTVASEEWNPAGNDWVGSIFRYETRTWRQGIKEGLSGLVPGAVGRILGRKQEKKSI
jgi:hypothetical protein